MNPVLLALGALGVGAAAFVVTGHKLPFTKGASALPAGKPVPVPAAPAAALNDPGYVPANGEGFQIYQSFAPNAPSVAQNVRALRYLGITSLIPSDVNGDEQNSDYKNAVAVFQQFAALPQTGLVDENTQAGLNQAVASRNADLHNLNVDANKTDVDWVTAQNALGAADSRGAWSVSGVSFGAASSMLGTQTRGRRGIASKYAHMIPRVHRTPTKFGCRVSGTEPDLVFANRKARNLVLDGKLGR